MTAYTFFSTLRMISCLALVILVSLIAFAGFICSELSTEARFRNTHGASWRLAYEEVHGPLAKARTKIAISLLGTIAISALTGWLFILLRNQRPRRPPAHRKAGRSRRYGSRLERA